jgi:GNAT superfamily N-acetyltransferase
MLSEEISRSMMTRLASAGDVALLKELEAVLRSRAEADFAERLLAHSGRTVVLGFFGGRAAGYAVVNWQPAYNLFSRLDIPELQDLNVLPADRGRGLGGALVKSCESLAREKGHAQMGLAVGLTRGYGAAQRLYARLGYIPDGYGVTYDRQAVQPGEIHAIDDNLCLMMVRDL